MSKAPLIADSREVLSLADLVAHAASLKPDGTAFIDGEHRRSWRTLATDVACLAAVLRSAELEPGDRVAIIAGVTRDHVEMTFALSHAGLVVVPLNTRLSQAEHSQILRDADVAVFLYDDTHRDHAHQVAVDAGVANLFAIETAIQSAATARALPDAWTWRRSDQAAILYTGGTTGSPKGVSLSVGALMAQGRTIQIGLEYDEASIVLHAQPIFHVAGTNQLYGLTAARGGLVFRTDVGPAATYEEIATHGVNSIGLVPTTLAMLLDHPKRDDALLRQLRSVVYGSAAITETLLARALDAMPNAGFCQFYGQTEAGGPLTSLRPEDHVLSGPHAGKLRTAGRALPGVDLRIADIDGNDVPTGTAGEIVIRSPGQCDGYWRNPDRTNELFQNDWLRTGDVGVLDDDGYVTIVDRFKDMIVTGGENVFCAEVEQAIASHPAVAACAVIGIPHAFWGEAVHAIIIPRDVATVSEDEILLHCRGQIAGYKCPKTVQFRSKPFPLSGVGKILKHKLRDEFITRLGTAS